MKNTIAKIFCFLTVLLLSSNVVISSSAYSYSNFDAKDQKKSIGNEHQFDKSSSNGSVLSFLAEQDLFEDFEIIADLPPKGFQFEQNIRYRSTLSTSFYNSNSYSFNKIPRWLWVRHIII